MLTLTDLLFFLNSHNPLLAILANTLFLVFSTMKYISAQLRLGQI